jgi:AraC-like DNA-binding protein
MIATFLPTESATYLQQMVPRAKVACANSWAQLERFVNIADCKLMVFDPSAGGAANTETPLRLLRKRPQLPALAYVTLSAKNFAACATLIRCGLPWAVLHPFQGGEKRFSELLDRVSASALAQEYLHYLEPSFHLLPLGLRWTIEDLFIRPELYRCGEDLAIAAGLQKRNLLGVLAAAHLGSPRKLVIAAKALHAYVLLQERDLKVAAASRRLRFSHQRVLRANILSIFGCSPSQMSAENETAEIVRQVLDWMYKPPARVVRNHFCRAEIDLEIRPWQKRPAPHSS